MIVAVYDDTSSARVLLCKTFIASKSQVELSKARVGAWLASKQRYLKSRSPGGNSWPPTYPEQLKNEILHKKLSEQIKV